MSRLRRSLHRGISCIAATGLLVGLLATSANAAVPAHVTVSQLRTALPAARQIPGLSVMLSPKVDLKGVFVVPCLTNTPGPKELLLPGSRDVTVNYDGPNVAPNSPKSVGWLVDLVSLPTPAAARDAMTRIAAGEKSCPRVWSNADIPPLVMTRTFIRKQASGGWNGYVTVTKLNFLHQWVLQTYLTRGNVLVALNQYVPDLPGTGPRQQAWRETSTHVLLTRLGHLLP